MLDAISREYTQQAFTDSSGYFISLNYEEEYGNLKNDDVKVEVIV